jgi:SAM-dependent methyltransferase
VSEGPGPAWLPREAAERLAEWLRGPRSRALRRAEIGRRRSVLEAGAGGGAVTAELRRRCAGRVVPLDREAGALGPGAVGGDFQRLPFRAESFDLVFFQNALLWATDLPAAVAEAARVLRPGGVLVALEPDYGGMLEHPELGLRELWQKALRRAGADPEAGRKLPGACEAAGLRPWVELAHLPRPFDAEALALLGGLALEPEERRKLAGLVKRVTQARGEWECFVHLPYVMVVGEKGSPTPPLADSGHPSRSGRGHKEWGNGNGHNHGERGLYPIYPCPSL